jgi:hypothetical protein
MFPLEFAAFAKLVDARHAKLRDYLARMLPCLRHRPAAFGARLAQVGRAA